MTEKKQKRIFFIIISAILLVGIISSLAIHLYKIEMSKHKVVFYDNEGVILEECRVKDGKCAKFKGDIPKIENHVFKGWNQNVNLIVQDTEVHPVYQDVSKENNAFFIDTYYTDGKSNITVDLKLGGIVNVTTAKIGIAFDNNVVCYKGINSSDYLSSNIEIRENYLIISFDIPKDFHSGDTIAQLTFSCLDVHSLVTDLPIDLLDVKVGEAKTDSTAINGLIYIY